MYRKDEISLFQMIETIEKIFKYSKNFSNSDELWNDDVYFDAVLMNFIALGEIVIKVSDDFKNKYNKIEWLKIQAFRNIVAHDYFGINVEEVWQIIKNHLPELMKELKSI
ncbi:MAG: DUF86 domain-containing protein [Bacteroidales bacterium]|nr:DUF86 domain-containing protein [Bacteroidales bacterium]